MSEPTNPPEAKTELTIEQYIELALKDVVAREAMTRKNFRTALDQLAGERIALQKLAASITPSPPATDQVTSEAPAQPPAEPTGETETNA